MGVLGKQEAEVGVLGRRVCQQSCCEMKQWGHGWKEHRSEPEKAPEQMPEKVPEAGERKNRGTEGVADKICVKGRN